MQQLDQRQKRRTLETTVRLDLTQLRRNSILNLALTSKSKAARRLVQDNIIKKNNYLWLRSLIIWQLMAHNFNEYSII